MTRVALVAIGVLGATLCAQSTNFLDLTQVTVARSDNTARSGNTVGTGKLSVVGLPAQSVRETLPLQIRLESMDRNEYREHDEIVFEISLQNVGRQPVTLPWEPDAEQVVTSAEAPLLEWLLVLSVDGPEFDKLTFPIRVLYGSTLSPATLKVLRPGEQARIRARGKWEFTTAIAAKRATAALPRTVEVAARLEFLSGHSSEVISVNRVPVLLEPR